MDVSLHSLLKRNISSSNSSLFISVGTAGIILPAPSLYDLRPDIDEMLSEIEAVAQPMGIGHAASYM